MEEKSTIRRIWNFAKDHQTITIAVVSGIIAVTTFLLKNSIYMNTKLYLSYFGINSSGIININDHQLYNIIWSIAIQIYFVFVTFLTEDLSSTYVQKRAEIKDLEKANKAIKKLETLNKKHTLDVLYNDKNISKEERINEYENLSFSNTVLSKTKIFRKSIRTIKKEFRKNMLFHLIIIFVGSLLLAFPYAMISSHSEIGVLVITLLYSSISVAFLLFFIFHKTITNKKKNKYPKDTEIEQIISDAEETKEFFIFRIVKNGLIDTLKEFSVLRVGFTMTISLLFFILLTTSTGYYSAKATKDFSVFETNDYSYAVIYDNGDLFVAEKIDINNKNVKIHKNDQIVKSNKDIPLKVIKFDNVELVDD